MRTQIGWKKSLAASVAILAIVLATLLLPAGSAVAKDIEGCNGPAETIDGVIYATLTQPSDPGNHLIVANKCLVKAGTYKFANINVLKNGTLRFADAVIDLWAANLLIENEGVVVAGSTATPIGTAGGRLTIHLYGADQTGTDPNRQGKGIACLSDYDWDCGIPENIWKSNLASIQGGMPKYVAPAAARTIAAIGAAGSYPGSKDDYFYAYGPLPFDAGLHNPAEADSYGYFGYKVLGVSYGGSLQLFGRKGATMETIGESSSGTSWVRLAQTVGGSKAGEACEAGKCKLVLDRKVDWAKPTDPFPGDRIVLTTTDYLPGHSEELTITDVEPSADGTATTLTVAEKVWYRHSGTRFPLPNCPDSDTSDRCKGFRNLGLDPGLVANGAETRAAVGLLTRSIRIVSEGDDLNTLFEAPPGGIPAGYKVAPPNYHFGGHVLVRQGYKAFQVQGVEFRQLGQGGRMGHYPVHFHLARIAQPDTFVRDSSINESMTRWIVLHGTQNVKLERNVGFKSIGHGFYLEDGTETGNALIANLGVFARAAVDNVQNPRKVPGILAAPDLHGTTGEDVPYRSDYDHPTVFWMMNGDNDFKYNQAVGAGACGVCYWLLPAINSTMSRTMKWTGYASMQANLDRAGMVPLRSFVGNGCSTAMTSFQTITATEACLGIGPGVDGDPGPFNLPPIRNPLAPTSKAPKGTPPDQAERIAAESTMYYPSLGDGGHFPTKCTTADCSEKPVRCSAGNLDACEIIKLDRYTTSFNWAAFNFAAIWLRPQWYLVTDSVITDVQQAGLTMVTGGGYSDSDVIPGHWALVRKTVFIGHTQDYEDNPFAANGGPFNPKSIDPKTGKAIRCAMNADGVRVGNFCLVKDEGITHQMSNFGMYQRLFSVYDGPAFQDSNAYLNIAQRKIDDCVPFVDDINHAGRCDPTDLSAGKPRQSAWLAGFVSGLLKARPDPKDSKKDYCYMPNAAIGWKQPNGFYYPPAFHSKNLFFDNVDIRHFVVSPLFKEGTYTTDITQVEDKYCLWNTSLFTGFAGNDRQTVLNDDDGTLTGYQASTVINKDPFFNAPIDAMECRSDASSRTSPYQYVTTVLYPGCVIAGTCARPPLSDKDPGGPDPRWNDGDWNRACTNENCYGVPLWRQNEMPLADRVDGQVQPVPKSIRMMGQETGQRSTLTVNGGTYYLDTTVDKATQLTQDCTSTNAKNPCVVNEFKEGQTYYVFLIYAKDTTKQVYRFYVGEGPEVNFDLASIKWVQADIGANPISFKDGKDLPAKSVKWYTGEKATAKGVVEVEFDVAKLMPATDLAKLYSTAKQDKCGPSSFCRWDTGASTCVGVDAANNDVCKWAAVDQDCPKDGCFGFSFTLPKGFKTYKPTAENDRRPPALCVKPGTEPFNQDFVANPKPDGTCPVAADRQKPDNFCGAELTSVPKASPGALRRR